MTKTLSGTVQSTLAALSLATLASAQTVQFEPIPDAGLANDMSPDGRWVVGQIDADGNGFPEALYRWDTVNDVMITLPGAFDATAVSDDGQTILGCMPDPIDGVEVAGIWTLATGWQSLGWLPNAGNCPSRSNGYELSADGTVAVGLSWDGCSGRAFRWTQATGMVELQALANGGNRASVLSADGSVIAGFAQGMFSRTPAMWTGGGAGALLDPPNGAVDGEIRGMSDDGAILLGTWDFDAARWTTAGGVEVVGNGTLLPGWVGNAMDIADDEGTVVGFDILFTNRRAWIQPQGDGLQRDLKTYVEAHGGTVPAGLILEVCSAISNDGRIIVGHGIGNAWRVIITPDCPADTDGNGSVDIDDVVNIVLCFGTDGVDCPGPGITTDVDANGIVDIDDVIAAVLAFGECPGT